MKQFFGPRYPLTFTARAEYTLAFDLSVINKFLYPDTTLSVYLVGPAFPADPVTSPLGYLLKTYDASNVERRNFLGEEINFIAALSGEAYLRFVFDSWADWHIANVKLDSAVEFGFNPDESEYNLYIQGKRFEQLQFKVELFDSNSNLVNILIETDPTFFNGGNQVVRGRDNRLDGNITLTPSGSGPSLAVDDSGSYIGIIGNNDLQPVARPTDPDTLDDYVGPPIVTIYSGSRPYPGFPNKGPAIGFQVITNTPTQSYFDVNTLTGLSFKGPSIIIDTPTFYLNSRAVPPRLALGGPTASAMIWDPTASLAIPGIYMDGEGKFRAGNNRSFIAFRPTDPNFTNGFFAISASNFAFSAKDADTFELTEATFSIGGFAGVGRPRTWNPSTSSQASGFYVDARGNLFVGSGSTNEAPLGNWIQFNTFNNKLSINADDLRVFTDDLIIDTLSDNANIRIGKGADTVTLLNKRGIYMDSSGSFRAGEDVSGSNYISFSPGNGLAFNANQININTPQPFNLFISGTQSRMLMALTQSVYNDPFFNIEPGIALDVIAGDSPIFPDSNAQIYARFGFRPNVAANLFNYELASFEYSKSINDVNGIIRMSGHPLIYGGFRFESPDLLNGLGGLPNLIPGQAVIGRNNRGDLVIANSASSTFYEENRVVISAGDESTQGWSINQPGHLYPLVDDAYDIGSGSAPFYRVRNIYLSGNIFVSSSVSKKITYSCLNALPTSGNGRSISYGGGYVTTGDDSSGIAYMPLNPVPQGITITGMSAVAGPVGATAGAIATLRRVNSSGVVSNVGSVSGLVASITTINSTFTYDVQPDDAFYVELTTIQIGGGDTTRDIRWYSVSLDYTVSNMGSGF